jgi:deoxyhypusine synthase
MGAVRAFMDHNFLHYNARVVVQSARAFEAHRQQGGKMLVSMAGAMSTAQIGRSLSRMIRAGHVHAISCTGANLEEDLFNLLAREEYVEIDDWRRLTREDDQAFVDQGLNRVTDSCIPETVMRHVQARLTRHWRAAAEAGTPKLPSEFIWDVLGEPDLAEHFQVDPSESWVLAAKQMGVPIWTPGWEDSTLGNVFTSAVIRGQVPSHGAVMHGTAQFQRLMEFYQEQHGADDSTPSIGFFQIGGGIAGDFAICTVPALVQDLELEDTPMWGYFCQISDAVTSYGGYSGAPPSEKISWGKLRVDTPMYMIESDATIVAPLIFGYVLGD